MIQRADHNEKFVVIANDMLRDNTLSLKAKGLLSLLLTFDNDFPFTITFLETMCKETRQAISRIMDELVEQGYVGKVGKELVIVELPVTKRNIPVLQNVTNEGDSNVTKCNKNVLQNVTQRNNKRNNKKENTKRKKWNSLSDIDERENDYDFIKAHLPNPLDDIGE